MTGFVRTRARAVGSSPFLRLAWQKITGLLYRLKHEIEIGPEAVKLIADLPAYRPVFHPWDLPERKSLLRLDDPRSVVTADRKYVLLQLFRQALRTCTGDAAECGVYKGGTAFLLAQTLRDTADSRKLYLLDSFAGMPDSKPALDSHQQGEFADTSLASVQKYLSGFTSPVYVPGFIPDVLNMIAKQPFCFIHIDLDLHDAIFHATDFFYPLVQSGGFLVYDDYGFASCAGARAAVDEFYKDKPEEPLVLPTGQCIVFKV